MGRRARDIGIMIGRLPPGPSNSLVDVPGVRVGQVTLIEGEGPLRPGQGPVRTGVTVILPHAGNVFRDKVVAAARVVNGYGKSVGLAQISELGSIESPIALTNTLNVGLVMDALVEYTLRQNPELGLSVPGSVNVVVGECNDSYLNDIRGRHVKAQHVERALALASADQVEEGAVGAGTGTSCFEFKGGIGTASRLVVSESGGYTVGVLVLSNFGRRADLLVDGVPVGRELAAVEPEAGEAGGSIVMVLGTDAPLSSRQLGRVASRCTVGLARTGSVVGHSSGDFVLAFGPTLTQMAARAEEAMDVERSGHIDSLFRAAAECTEEAILNSMLMAETTIGRDGHVREALPLDRLAETMRRHGRQVQL